MNLRFTPRAVQDIAEIAEYIRQENPSAAERVRASILGSLESLSQLPLIGRMQTRENIRKLVTPKYRYVIYYLVDTAMDEVVVLSVHHPSRARLFEDR